MNGSATARSRRRCCSCRPSITPALPIRSCRMGSSPSRQFRSTAITTDSAISTIALSLLPGKFASRSEEASTTRANLPRSLPTHITTQLRICLTTRWFFFSAVAIAKPTRLSEIAWSLLGRTPPGWGRVQAICDYVHHHIVSVITRISPAAGGSFRRGCRNPGINLGPSR
jgi:transglutaminase-like putative cysteine protease